MHAGTATKFQVIVANYEANDIAVKAQGYTAIKLRMNMRMFMPVLIILGANYHFILDTHPQPGTVSISINPKFSGQTLVLGNQLYYTSNGDSLYLERFRYYISAVELQGKNSNYFKESDSYHLVDAELVNTQFNRRNVIPESFEV